MSFVKFAVKPESVTSIADHTQLVRLRILGALRLGTQQAMEGLANYIVGSKLEGQVLSPRTGQLASKVLSGVSVRDTPRAIRGRVAIRQGRKAPYGRFLEYGFKVPEVRGRLMVFTAGGKTIFTHRHRAYEVAARPFMQPSIREYAARIIDTLRARLNEALP